MHWDIMQLFRKQSQMLSSSLWRNKSLHNTRLDQNQTECECGYVCASALQRLEGRFATSTHKLGHSDVQVTLVTEAGLKQWIHSSQLCAQTTRLRSLCVYQQ